ncbi:MAG: ion transporter [Betaproteobacteria bacterium]|nr:ion transporter [Betaproteobacteria bacterium]
MTTAQNLPKSLRAQIYDLGFNASNQEGYAKKLDTFIAALIIANLVALMLETIPVIYEANAALFHAFDKISVIIFTVEYLTRLYVAPEDPEFSKAQSPRFAYLKSPFALIDLAAILPFYLAAFFEADLRVLRALRLLRLFKLLRVLMPAIHEFKELNKGKTLRQQVYALINPTDTSGKLHEYFDTLIVWWVLISVSAVILESVQMLEGVFHVEFVVLDAVAVMIFSIEYILRLYSCVEDPRFQGAVSGRLRYAKSPIAVIDLLAIVPFYLEVLLHSIVDLRFLRIFRLMRLLKLTRYTQATGTLFKALKREWPIIAASTFIMLLLVVLTASLGYLFEHEAQPDKFENIPQSIYWAVVTLASVGYGDISPVTPVGRLMTMIMALVGIGIFAVPAAILSTAFNDQLHKDREQMHNELYRFMEDGILDESERAIIYDEAKRLHITEEEVDLLIERVRQEREATTGGHLPFDLIKREPEVAFEQFRQVIGQLRQIASVSQTEAVSKLFSDQDRATSQEREIWERLSRGSGR